MYCPRCGSQNADDAAACTNCGNDLSTWRGEDETQSRPTQSPQSPPPPPAVYVGTPQQQQPYYAPGTVPNYLVQSILVTLCCCLPAGIPAIVYAAQVNGKLQSGDITGAMNSSKNARTWCWVSFGLGIAIGVIQLLAIGGSGFSGTEF